MVLENDQKYLSLFKRKNNRVLPGGIRIGKLFILTPFKINPPWSMKPIDQRKVGLLLNLPIVSPQPKTKKLAFFSNDLFIYCW